jgi:2-polyprenyl-6-methoxyphenol hydroxylase-like FAD-dependent oxidoreductase
MAEAYVLAGELDRADGDHDQAFRAYDALMHPFVESKQATAARFVGFFATRTRFGLWMRNAVMRAMNCRPVLNLVAGDFRDDLDLPEYAI